MTTWVLAPITILFLGCAACLAVGFRRTRRRRGAGWVVSVAFGLPYAVAFAMALGVISSLVPSAWLHARTTPHWEAKAKQADVAVIFGYGLGPTRRPMTPGRSNVQLFEWTLERTSAPTLLVQEGVWVVRCSENDETCIVDGRALQRMHRHVEGVRVDTLEAARCAAEKLLAMRAKRVVVVAHDLQLARAAWDLGRALRMLGGSDVELVVADVGIVVSPGSGTQWQTCARWEYKLVEMFWARPRDFLRCFPEQCPAP